MRLQNGVASTIQELRKEYTAKQIATLPLITPTQNEERQNEQTMIISMKESEAEFNNMPDTSLIRHQTVDQKQNLNKHKKLLKRNENLGAQKELTMK